MTLLKGMPFRCPKCQAVNSYWHAKTRSFNCFTCQFCGYSATAEMFTSIHREHLAKTKERKAHGIK
jgi:transcription elongation factor Elf1